jgi:hypothetical protein
MYLGCYLIWKWRPVMGKKFVSLYKMLKLSCRMNVLKSSQAIEPNQY